MDRDLDGDSKNIVQAQLLGGWSVRVPGTPHLAGRLGRVFYSTP